MCRILGVLEAYRRKITTAWEQRRTERREKKQRCEVVAWLLCGLRFERASFPPISSHEKGPEGEKRDASKR